MSAVFAVVSVLVALAAGVGVFAAAAFGNFVVGMSGSWEG